MRKLLVCLTAFLLFTGSLLAQKTITGTVSDDKGTPLPNVSVVVRGTNSGTVTKSDGSYSLTLPANARQLTFSFLGYEAQTVNLGADTRYSIALAPTSTREIDEVIVTGINRIKKSQFTGAANKIDVKEIQNRPVGSMDQLLQGRAPGVLALTGSGQPGNNTTILIRGTSSIVGGSSPLYIVDGIPVEAGVFQGLNPNDFASIDIARDAATTALYGSRGSAGVIIVTTKRGTSGKMRLTYNGQIGIKSKPDFAFRPMTTSELLKTQEQYGMALDNLNTQTSDSNAYKVNIPGWYYSPLNPGYTANPGKQSYWNRQLDSISRINTNWYDFIFRQGTFSNHQVSVSGGTGKTRIYSSLALYNEEGTTTRTDMKRATLRTNVDYADEKLTFAVSSNFGYTKRNFQQSTVTNSTANPFLIPSVNAPYALVYKPDGNYNTGNGARFTGANQLDLTNLDKNYNDQLKATLGINMGYRITENVSLNLVTGIDFRETQGTGYTSRLAYLRSAAAGASITAQAGGQTENLERFLTSNARASITYRKLFGERHDIEVTGMGEYLQENYKFFTFTGYGIDPRTPNTPAAIQPGNANNQLYITAGGNKDRNAISSGLVTGRYTLDGKYTVTGSYRYDGSSKLPKDSRWQGFYSIGGIWEVTRENFMGNIRAINVLRVRASYGGAGNANNFPSSYLYQATYGSGQYAGLPTQISTYVGNPEVKWEKTYVLNIGLDFEILNRRIYGDLNWYDKRTKDLFVRRTLALETSGGAQVSVNSGELQNTGFEWNINGDVLRNSNLVWTLFATGSYNKNKLLDLGGEPPYASGTSYLKIGLPLGSHNEVKWGGVDAATGAPLYYDLAGNLTTTYNASNAVTEFGTWEAPWKGGFGTNLRYKGFDFSVLFSWQAGAKKYDNLEYFVENPVGFLANGYNQSASLRFWMKPGDIVSIPSPKFGTNFSSKLIHDASFVRLRDVTIAYTVPSNAISRLRFVSNVRFYVQGTNLFMWTKWRGPDPEAGPVNINLTEYPNPRAFTGGIDVTF